MKASHRTIHQNIMELMIGNSVYCLNFKKTGYLFFVMLHRYSKWLPDNVVGRHDTKTTYQVEIRYANNTNETHTFHGPPGIFIIN